jgi:raffinose/stachyose/melibiose transport system permease protein
MSVLDDTEPAGEPGRDSTRPSLSPRNILWSSVTVIVTTVVFVIPFLFILSQAVKTSDEARRLDFTWPSQVAIVQNFQDVLQARDYMLLIAFINSTILTVGSVTLMVILGAMVGYVLQRRQSRWNVLINLCVFAGLIIPPAVVPTVWVLQKLHLFGTMSGMILIELAFGLAFCVLLFRAFVSQIPKELDEAALIDGASPLRLFFRIIFPLLKPVVITVVVVQSVFVFNDFQNPLYFFPGDENATVQLTLYNFSSQYETSYNLLFMNILLITIPPLIAYVIFQRQIVAGMTAGSVKG